MYLNRLDIFRLDIHRKTGKRVEHPIPEVRESKGTVDRHRSCIHVCCARLKLQLAYLHPSTMSFQTPRARAQSLPILQLPSRFRYRSMARLTIFYGGDGQAWFEYVKSRLEEDVHTHIVPLNLETEDWNNAKKSDFLLIILTPDLVNRVASYEKEFLHMHNVVAAPSRTFGLYLGCDESSVSDVQWNGFDRWTFSSLGSGEQEVIDSAVESIKNFVRDPIQDNDNSDTDDNPMARVLKEMQKKKMKRSQGSCSAVSAKTENSSTKSVAFATVNEEPNVGVTATVTATAAAEESTDSQPSSRTESPLPLGEDAVCTTSSSGVRGLAQKLQLQLKPVDNVPENVRKSLPPKPKPKPSTSRNNDTKTFQKIPQFSVTRDKPKPPEKLPKEVNPDQSADTDSEPEETGRARRPETPPKPRSNSVPLLKPLASVKSTCMQQALKECPDPSDKPEGTMDAISSTGAKESEKKRAKFRIFPSKFQYNDEILIILQEPSTEPQLSVKIENRKLDQRDGKLASRVNDYNFSFTFDCLDVSSGELHVIVFEQKKTCLGSRKIQYRSNSDIISEILPTLATPIEMMCDILNLDSANTAALDQHFTRSYHEHSPRQTGPFYNFANENISEKSDRVLPTLLHLSAKYGLIEFAKLLITFPSASLAYRKDNRDGLSPKDIAEMENHADLVKFFENYEIAIMEYETNLIYEDMMTTEHTNSGMAEEDIYLSMNECYRPKYQVASTQYQQSIYDYYCASDGTQKCMKLIMKNDEDSNSDDGPPLRIPKDDFAQERSRSDSGGSDDASYLDMQGMPGPRPNDDADEDEDDYIDGDLAFSGMTGPSEMPVGSEKRQRPLPQRPAAAPAMRPGKSRMPSSAQSLLDAPAEEENPYSDQSSSMNELILIQQECKEGMFSHEETLKRFEHWKAKFDTGTSKSLKTRMTNLQRIRRYFADKGSKKDEIDITVLVEKTRKVTETKKLARAPEPLPRVDLAPVRFQPNKKQRSDSSRSVSTASSGSSRTSNLSQISVGDSGNVTEEIYEEYPEQSPISNTPKAKSNVYTQPPALRDDSPPPPVPPRKESRPRPLPSSVRSTRRDDQDDDVDEIFGLPQAPSVPPLPPRNY